MAIDGRLVDDKASTANTTSYPSDVPSAGSVVETHLVAVMNTIGTGEATLPTLSGGGLTWTQEETVSAGTNRRTTVFRARGTNTAAVVTADFGVTSQTGCIIIWPALDETDSVNDGVVQSEPNAGTGTSGNATLAAVGVGNAVVSFACSNIGGDFTAEDPPFTELSDVEYATPTTSGHAMWGVTTDTTPTHTAPSSSSWRIVALEVKKAVTVVERSASLGATVGVAVGHQRDLHRSAAIGASVSVETQHQRELQRSAAVSTVVSLSVQHQRELLRQAAVAVGVDLEVQHQRELLRQLAVVIGVDIQTLGEIEPPGGPGPVGPDEYDAWTYWYKIRRGR